MLIQTFISLPGVASELIACIFSGFVHNKATIAGISAASGVIVLALVLGISLRVCRHRTKKIGFQAIRPARYIVRTSSGNSSALLSTQDGQLRSNLPETERATPVADSIVHRRATLSQMDRPSKSRTSDENDSRTNSRDMGTILSSVVAEDSPRSMTQDVVGSSATQASYDTPVSSNTHARPPSSAGNTFVTAPPSYCSQQANDAYVPVWMLVPVPANADAHALLQADFARTQQRLPQF